MIYKILIGLDALDNIVDMNSFVTVTNYLIQAFQLFVFIFFFINFVT